MRQNYYVNSVFAICYLTFLVQSMRAAVVTFPENSPKDIYDQEFPITAENHPQRKLAESNASQFGPLHILYAGSLQENNLGDNLAFDVLTYMLQKAFEEKGYQMIIKAPQLVGREPKLKMNDVCLPKLRKFYSIDYAKVRINATHVISLVHLLKKHQDSGDDNERKLLASRVLERHLLRGGVYSDELQRNDSDLEKQLTENLQLYGLADIDQLASLNNDWKYEQSIEIGFEDGKTRASGIDNVQSGRHIFAVGSQRRSLASCIASEHIEDMCIALTGSPIGCLITAIGPSLWASGVQAVTGSSIHRYSPLVLMGSGTVGDPGVYDFRRRVLFDQISANKLARNRVVGCVSGPGARMSIEDSWLDVGACHSPALLGSLLQQHQAGNMSTPAVPLNAFQTGLRALQRLGHGAMSIATLWGAKDSTTPAHRILSSVELAAGGTGPEHSQGQLGLGLSDLDEEAEAVGGGEHLPKRDLASWGQVLTKQQTVLLQLEAIGKLPEVVTSLSLPAGKDLVVELLVHLCSSYKVRWHTLRRTNEQVRNKYIMSNLQQKITEQNLRQCLSAMDSPVSLDLTPERLVTALDVIKEVDIVVTVEPTFAALAAGAGKPFVMIGGGAVGRDLAAGLKVKDLHIEDWEIQDARTPPNVASLVLRSIKLGLQHSQMLASSFQAEAASMWEKQQAAVNKTLATLLGSRHTRLPVLHNCSTFVAEHMYWQQHWIHLLRLSCTAFKTQPPL